MVYVTLKLTALYRFLETSRINFGKVQNYINIFVKIILL